MKPIAPLRPNAASASRASIPSVPMQNGTWGLDLIASRWALIQPKRNRRHRPRNASDKRQAKKQTSAGRRTGNVCHRTVKEIEILCSFDSQWLWRQQSRFSGSPWDKIPRRRLAVTRDMRRLLPVVGVVAAGVGIHGTSGQSQQSRSLRTSDTNLALSPEILLSTQTPLQGLFRDCRQLEIQAILSMCLKPAS